MFKANALCANLKTKQQNAVAFHAFTTAFCPPTNQTPPPEPIFPLLRTIPIICIEEEDQDKPEGEISEDVIITTDRDESVSEATN